MGDELRLECWVQGQKLCDQSAGLRLGQRFHLDAMLILRIAKAHLENRGAGMSPSCARQHHDRGGLSEDFVYHSPAVIILLCQVQIFEAQPGHPPPAPRYQVFDQEGARDSRIGRCALGGRLKPRQQSTRIGEAFLCRSASVSPDEASDLLDALFWFSSGG
jgi:hypothetical protein